jgi:tetratricopeptide (TPR) repeat protein
MHQLRLIPLVIVLGALAARPAAAAPDRREVEARADFAAGRYQQAIDLFAQLYGETLNPIYLRNIGRCQQKLRRPQEAIDAFREYLKKAKAMKAEERQEVEGYIAEMERLQQVRPAETVGVGADATATSPQANAPTPVAPLPPAAAPAPATPASVPSPSASAAPAAPTVAEPVVPATIESGPTPRPAEAASVILAAPPPTGGTDGRGWRTAGVITAAGGLALVGVGVGFGLDARSAASSVSSAYDPQRAESGRTNARIGWVFDAAGAAAVAAGVVMVLHGHRDAPSAGSAGSLRVGAAAARGSGGIIVGGEF